jgi:hypothetical protein
LEVCATNETVCVVLATVELVVGATEDDESDVVDSVTDVVDKVTDDEGEDNTAVTDAEADDVAVVEAWVTVVVIVGSTLPPTVTGAATVFAGIVFASIVWIIVIGALRPRPFTSVFTVCSSSSSSSRAARRLRRGARTAGNQLLGIILFGREGAKKGVSVVERKAVSNRWKRKRLPSSPDDRKRGRKRKRRGREVGVKRQGSLARANAHQGASGRKTRALQRRTCTGPHRYHFSAPPTRATRASTRSSTENSLFSRKLHTKDPSPGTTNDTGTIIGSMIHTLLRALFLTSQLGWSKFGSQDGTIVDVNDDLLIMMMPIMFFS